MSSFSHRFVHEHDGMIAFGLDRKTDVDSLIRFLQRLSDDETARLLAERLTGEEIDSFVDYLMGLMRSKLTEEEYHRYFLKDG